MLRSIVRRVVALLRRHLFLILAAFVLLAVFAILWFPLAYTPLGTIRVWSNVALRMRPFSTAVKDVVAMFRPYLQAILAGVLGLGLLVLMLWKVPKRQASGVQDIKDRLTIENAARQTLAQIVGGAAILAGLYFTAATLRTTQEGQITDRFTKAIAQLGEQGREKLAVRLGGIYALERIAKDSEKDYGPIMEVLTAYVRETAPWRPNPPKDAQPSKGDQSPQEEPPTTPDQQNPRPATDIQAILTVLGRRIQTYGNGEEQRLNLTNTDLRGADLIDARLQKADLIDARLQGANLAGAQLQGADLIDARLQGAVLRRAQLQGARLTIAQLEGAKDLTVEQLSTVKTLYGAQLDPPLLEQIQRLYPQLLEWLQE